MEDFTVQWIPFALLTVLVFENNLVAGEGSKYERFYIVLVIKSCDKLLFTLYQYEALETLRMSW